jgi:hypothetical protein
MIFFILVAIIVLGLLGIPWTNGDSAFFSLVALILIIIVYFAGSSGTGPLKTEYLHTVENMTANKNDRDWIYYAYIDHKKGRTIYENDATIIIGGDETRVEKRCNESSKIWVPWTSKSCKYVITSPKKLTKAY